MQSSNGKESDQTVQDIIHRVKVCSRELLRSVVAGMGRLATRRRGSDRGHDAVVTLGVLATPSNTPQRLIERCMTLWKEFQDADGQTKRRVATELIPICITILRDHPGALANMNDAYFLLLIADTCVEEFGDHEEE